MGLLEMDIKSNNFSIAIELIINIDLVRITNYDKTIVTSALHYENSQQRGNDNNQNY